jgi:glyoxylase-like metal-dependent hydrolase (beta-lactamase superfamily II)
MIVERSMSRSWLSNTYLVADEPGGHAVLVDTGGPSEPILAKIDEWSLTVTHALCTHHHGDHVSNNALYRGKLGCKVCGHAKESHLFGELDAEISGGDEIRSGGLHIRCLHVPGHTLGQLAYVINEQAVFTGDTLFRGAIGGTRGSGHTCYGEIKHSIMEVLMKLPREMAVYPGHTDPTTIGEEWEQNPFIRIWRGLDAPGNGRCVALGEPARLILRARDYDGGTKCWVRFEEGDIDDIVPGSAVEDVPA